LKKNENKSITGNEMHDEGIPDVGSGRVDWPRIERAKKTSSMKKTGGHEQRVNSHRGKQAAWLGMGGSVGGKVR